jgi:hypothetical protein
MHQGLFEELAPAERVPDYLRQILRNQGLL